MQSPLYKNARIYIDGHFQTGGFEVIGRRGSSNSASKPVFASRSMRRLVYIIQIRVPRRAPKRQSKGCLFFCQSMAAKTPKTPGFPTKMGTQGLFVHSILCASIYNHLHPFSSTSPPSRRQKLRIYWGLIQTYGGTNDRKRKCC